MYYFCTMVKKTIFILFFGLAVGGVCDAQFYIRTIDLVANKSEPERPGKLNIIQDPRIDTLLSRNMAANKIKNGMDGFRIQIYIGSDRNAREEAAKAKAKFINEYPDIDSYDRFEKPNWFKVRVGDYRTRHEATKALYEIRRVFKDAYIVEEIIKFPDLNNQ
jgi:hypothetical protein